MAREGEKTGKLEGKKTLRKGRRIGSTQVNAGEQGKYK